jgi:DNA-binding transcriptional LysR family regulator
LSLLQIAQLELAIYASGGAMRFNRFLLSSDECELLLEFETHQTIERTATAMAKDPSGVSRALALISRKYPALEKRNGRWVLTHTGKRLNSLTRNSIQIQKRLAEDQAVLRIGTNREFAARVMGPEFKRLTGLFQNTQLVILTFEYGVEEALLNGRIDVGIDCERPLDPTIAYKMLISEPIVAVCTKEFRKRFAGEIEGNRLYQTPHLLCERLYPDKIFSEQENRLNVTAMFNDIASTRAACLTGAGWGLLPRYAVREEIDAKKLIVISEKNLGQAKYGVWWSRARQTPPDVIQQMCDWVRQQRL